MRARSLTEEASVRGVSTELLIVLTHELRILDPINKGLVVVAEQLLLMASLKTGNICPRLSCFLHGIVVVFVDALAARNKTIIMVSHQGGGCYLAILHPGVVLGLLECKSLGGVLFGQSDDQIKEFGIGLDFTVVHSTNGVTVEAAVV